jgi:hypothetical protein
MRKITKRSAAIAATAVLALGAIGGAAWAGGWLIKGEADVSATGAKVQDMSAKITLDGNAYPGRVLTATAKVNNPNEFPVNLTKVTGAGSLNATRGGTTNAPCVTKLAALGTNAFIPQLPVTGSTKINKEAVGQSISLNLTISPDFPQECQDSLITAKVNFEGASTV